MKRTVIFDFIGTLFDYERGDLYSGVAHMLAELSKTRLLLLLSRQEGGRHDLISELGIAPHFAATYFVQRKTPEVLADILSEHDLKAGETIIVGDLPRSELAAGKALGAETIWIRQGRFFHEMPNESNRPTHIVESIEELHKLLSGLP
ncbi:HAD hydrolase-like protein [Candidatus Kaiserbacteria bacterium]|nr:HAD hydrolase-like protein [Candidatus Kaiserbacteria bacterium]